LGQQELKIRARDISKIKGFLEIFVEGVDHCIKFDHELPKKKAPAENPQTQNKNQEAVAYLGFYLRVCHSKILYTVW
jgi:hypothetical protein